MESYQICWIDRHWLKLNSSSWKVFDSPSLIGNRPSCILAPRTDRSTQSVGSSKEVSSERTWANRRVRNLSLHWWMICALLFPLASISPKITGNTWRGNRCSRSWWSKTVVNELLLGNITAYQRSSLQTCSHYFDHYLTSSSGSLGSDCWAFSSQITWHLQMWVASNLESIRQLYEIFLLWTTILTFDLLENIISCKFHPSRVGKGWWWLWRLFFGFDSQLRINPRCISWRCSHLELEKQLNKLCSMKQIADQSNTTTAIVAITSSLACAVLFFR